MSFNPGSRSPSRMSYQQDTREEMQSYSSSLPSSNRYMPQQSYSSSLPSSNRYMPQQSYPSPSPSTRLVGLPPTLYQTQSPLYSGSMGSQYSSPSQSRQYSQQMMPNSRYSPPMQQYPKERLSPNGKVIHVDPLTGQEYTEVVVRVPVEVVHRDHFAIETRYLPGTTIEEFNETF